MLKKGTIKMLINNLDKLLLNSERLESLFGTGQRDQANEVIEVRYH